MSFSNALRACLLLLALLFAPGARGATHIINIGDNFFGPTPTTLYSFSITAGDTVTWTNTGFANHNVTSTGSPTFTSSPFIIPRNGAYTFTFPTAGTYNYTCTLHFNQNGVLIVTNASANQLPTVSITSPTNGMKLLAGSTATITTTAQDADGTVQRVEFYESGTNFIGVVSNTPFNLTSTNIMPGNFALSARVFDNLGASNNSATVNIQVLTNATLLVDPALTNQPAFHVSNAISGQTYVFEALTNLGAGSFGSRWFPIATNVASGTNFIFNDTVLTNFFPRLYRVRQDL